MKPVPSPKTSGFTLVEILVAMAVFALVITAIYSTWMAIIRSSQAADVALANVQRERIAMRTLEETLSSARSFVADRQHYAFIAENGSTPILSFVARLPDSFPRSGKFDGFDIRRVTYTIENGSLILRQQPVLMELSDDEKNYPLVLAKNVKSFLIEMKGPQGLQGQRQPGLRSAATQDNEWLDEWTDTNQIPALIRVSLEIENPSPHNSFAARTTDVTVREIALPSVAVQPVWQSGKGQGNRPPGAPPGVPPPLPFQPRNFNRPGGAMLFHPQAPFEPGDQRPDQTPDSLGSRLRDSSYRLSS